MRWSGVGRMPDAPMNRLLNLKVARDRKGMAPNKPLLVMAMTFCFDALKRYFTGWSFLAEIAAGDHGC